MKQVQMISSLVMSNSPVVGILVAIGDGSPAAVHRLLSDLKMMSKSNGKFGICGTPRGVSRCGQYTVQVFLFIE